MVVHSSTQNPTEIQVVVAEMLGVGQHEVVCICKRMGGAFGGKETQAAIPAMLAALVAHKTGRAARVIYNKDDDMISTGKRHPYRSEWEVGFDDTGRILGLKTQFYSNGGASTDLSLAVMERTLLHADNAYYLADIDIHGHVCFTNLPSNTAFRGFGGPQAMAVIENIVGEIAQHLGLDPLDVQRRNLYGVGERNVTPYGQVFDRNHLPEIVETLAESSDYVKRRTEIERQNATDRLRLRGIALTPVKFGISFTTSFMNQANALVNIYTDGTIQVSTGGTEMGQGVNTKIRQLVADEFGVSWERVLLMPTSTEKNTNTSPTAASAGTDLNGAAAVDACRQIKSRLAEFAVRHFGSDAKSETGQFWRVVRCRAAGPGRPRRPRFLRHAGRRFQSRDRPRHAVFLLHARGGGRRGRDRSIHRRAQRAARRSVDRHRPVDQSGRRSRAGDRRVHSGHGLGDGRVPGVRRARRFAVPFADDVQDSGDHRCARVFNCEFFTTTTTCENVSRSKAVGEPPLMLAICVWAAVKNALRCVAPQRRIDLQIAGDWRGNPALPDGTRTETD